MMRLVILVSCLAALSTRAFAQAPAPTRAPQPPARAPEPPPPVPDPAAEPEAEPAEAAPAEEPEGAAAPEEGASTLAPPSLAPIEIPGQGPAMPLAPDPSASAQMLQNAAPKTAPEEKKGWTAPETVFHLHGYFRGRGTLLKNGWLGHSQRGDRLYAPGRTNYDPFSFFQPADRGSRINLNGKGVPVPGTTTTDGKSDVVQGGCDASCDKQSQVSADMRLRLKPEIHLSDDVRVKAWVDLLDNVGGGTLGYGTSSSLSGDTLRVRRAWAEARNRDIGELRFGRMGADWGLGILDNGGDRYGIDSDFASNVDRVMGVTNFAGFYFMAAYDWASEGSVLAGSASPSGVPIDQVQSDDLDAVTLSVAHKMEPELQQSALLRGEAVFNYGAYFVYRDQLLQRAAGLDSNTTTPTFLRLNQTEYIPDLWFQVLWEGLRVEAEGVYRGGTIEGGCPKLINSGNDNAATEVLLSVTSANATGAQRDGPKCRLRQFGIALETEYRLFDERLGLYLYSGFASGDSQARGLAATNDSTLQTVSSDKAKANRRVSTYSFHPDYRIDLILWRTLMQRVAGAYYVKPGVSYDFIHDPYGQLAGGRLDFVYSRASNPDQTWGGKGNLGLEIDLSLYYRSEDGPDLLDGFYSMAQWGVLFPFGGLEGFDGEGDRIQGKTAMVLRAVAGVAF